MIVSRRSASNSSMQQRRNYNSGWAAFDRKQKAKQGILLPTEGVHDEFPPFTSEVPAKSVNSENVRLEKSFASVAHPSSGYQVDSVARDGNRDMNYLNIIDPSIKRLKNANQWADLSLIKDVLAAADNDEQQALDLLKGMISDNSMSEETSSSTMRLSDSFFPGNENQGLETSIQIEAKMEDSEKAKAKVLDGHQEVFTSRQLFYLPVEPEREEDDVYLNHRKDALKMMRSASQHSRAASSAYLRGDHLSAQMHSQRAQREWLAAQELNNKAAKEILRIRNSNNDVWKLDLHGLHASEAVIALNDHLNVIESQFLMNRIASSSGLTKAGPGISQSSNSLHGSECIPSTLQKKAFSHEKPSILHVITGMGNHSRGQAALPAAVKSFLIDKGYWFDESRPGVIAVRPKFRH